MRGGRWPSVAPGRGGGGDVAKGYGLHQGDGTRAVWAAGSSEEKKSLEAESIPDTLVRPNLSVSRCRARGATTGHAQKPACSVSSVLRLSVCPRGGRGRCVGSTGSFRGREGGIVGAGGGVVRVEVWFIKNGLVDQRRGKRWWWCQSLTRQRDTLPPACCWWWWCCC